MLDGDWYLLVTVDNTEAKAIVGFSRKTYGERWQKRFSEDFVDVLTAMGKPPGTSVKLKLIKDSKMVEKTLVMTTENRRKVRDYNNANSSAEGARTGTEAVERVQKNLASVVNIKNEKLYPFKSAKFESVYTGHRLYSGTETVYIDDYGKTVIVISDKPNSPLPENSTAIWKDIQTLFINHLKKSYYTTPVRTKSTEPPVIKQMLVYFGSNPVVCWFESSVFRVSMRVSFLSQ